MKKKLLVLILSTSSCAFSNFYQHNLEDSFVALTPKVKETFFSNASDIFSHLPIISKGIKNPCSSYEHKLDDSFVVLAPVNSECSYFDDKNQSQLIVNKNFTHNITDYADMIDLSYHLAKGRNEQSTPLMETLFGKGWNLKAFSGFSGKFKEDTHKYDAVNLDLAGFVAFNKSTGEAVVTFHGSQDNYDWQNNLDGRKVSALENGLKFEGGVHRGINYRYQSSKQSIYTLLDRFYDELDNKDLFHITTTGHSLGGGMANIGYADLGTDYIKGRLGEAYDNNIHNRVRAYAVSSPRVFDDVAHEDIVNSVGTKNIIADAVEYDPVTMVGPGKSVTKWLENSSKRGPTAGLLKIAKWFGGVPTSNPGKVAQLFGNFQHLGTKAPANGAEIKKLAKVLDSRDAEDQAIKRTIKKKSIFEQIESYVTKAVGHLHYGRVTPWGNAFEKRFLEGETIEERINNINNNINVSVIQPVIAPSTSWWGKIKGLFTTK